MVPMTYSMTAPRTLLSRSSRTSRIAALAAAAVVLFVASACTPQNEAQDRLNNDRVAYGLAPLPAEAQLFAKAQSWADYMASTRQISHSNLVDGLPAGWRYAGENVGCGNTLAAIEESFMNSAGHRANILGTRWTHVASGVARGDCVTSSGFVIKNAYFVAQVFVQL